jgi:hypothetical protein
MSTAKAAQAIVQIASALIECIQESGPRGVPEGELYAILMPTGCNLEQFNQLVSILVGSGRVKKQGHLLLAA